VLDFGKLIRDRVPDKDGRTLPLDVMYGTYSVKDLTDTYVGNLYEGKVILDKTNGHAAYGCAWCCGYSNVHFADDPLGVAVAGFANQTVLATNQCTNTQVDITNLFNNGWWTGDTSIATANNNQIHGVAMGSTSLSAPTRTLVFGNERMYGDTCPMKNQTPAGTGNVCGFTVSPQSGTASDCTNGTQNQQTFQANIYPTTCTYDSTHSSCSATAKTGTIDLVVGTPTCSVTYNPPAAVVKYYAGPPLPDGSAGTITQGFTLHLAGGNVTNNVDAPIECPK